MYEKNVPPLQLMIFSAVFYGFCSGSMNFINKYVMTSLDYPFPSVMMLLQLVMLACGLRFLKIMGYINLNSYDYKNAKTVALQSVLYSANTAIALFALNGMNLPMYNALRRCSPFATMILGYFVFGKKPTTLVLTSILVVTCGAFIAAYGDLAFDMAAYVFGSISVFLMACNLTMVQYNGTERLFSTNDLLYINSINCIPIMALVCWMQSDEILQVNYLSDSRLIPALILVVVSGCFLNYSMFLCTTVNSALTTTCVGVIKSVATTIIGMFTFGGVVPTAPFVFGQTLNFLGSCAYAYGKYKLQTKQTLPK